MAAHIVRLAGVQPGDRVVEVGPGLGSLTLALCEAGASVRAVELDRRLAGVLAKVVAGKPVEIVQADALTVDWAELLADGDRWIDGVEPSVQRRDAGGRAARSSARR